MLRQILAIFCSAGFQEETSCSVLIASFQEYQPPTGEYTYKEV
jgi:hypothetical protein